MTPRDSSPLGFRRTRRFLAAPGVLFLALIGPAAIPAWADMDDNPSYLKDWTERDKGSGWNFSPAFNGGYTSLLHGYKGYKNLGNAGLDLYMRPPVPQFPRWYNHMIFRLSADYFPLQVPSQVVGITEDIYALTGTALWRFSNASEAEHNQWIPFLGAGVGVYWDSVTVDTLATGKVKDAEQYLGVTGALGVMLPTWGPIRIIPEIRYHTLREAGRYWASHMTYQIGAALWFPAKVSEQ
jgi:hypothetical protein